MQIIINKDQFQSALRGAEKIISKNISLPILSSVLLKTENNRLKVSATNLELGILFWLPAKINKEGSAAVPIRVLSDFISNLDEEKIIITSEKNNTSINTKKYKTQILGLDPKDFPIIPKSKNEKQIKIEVKTLHETLIAVIDSVALSESRPELSGVFINLREEWADFAATDGFRLAEKQIPLSSEVTKSLILPRGAALELIRLTEDGNSLLSLMISENQFFVYGDNFEFISRLIDGKYPEYKRLVPEKHLGVAKVNKKELEKGVRAASVFSSSISDIKVEVEEDSIKISAKNSIKGEVSAQVECQAKEPFEIAVNYHYLLDGLKSISEENVLIFFTGEGSPLMIKGENNKNHLYLIMPLKI